MKPKSFFSLCKTSGKQRPGEAGRGLHPQEWGPVIHVMGVWCAEGESSEQDQARSSLGPVTGA